MGGTTVTIRIYSRFVTAEELIRAGSVFAKDAPLNSRCGGTPPKHSDQRRNKQWEKHPVDRVGCVHFRPGLAYTDQGHIRSPNDQAQPGAI
jgi:hypothetical protein